MMSLVAFCFAICGAQQEGTPIGAADSKPAPAPAAEKRPFHEIQKEMSALFKQEALTKDAAERAGIARRLCEMHTEIRLDPRHEYAEAMKGYRAQVWTRLKRIQTDLKNQLARLRKVKATEVGTDPELLAASDSLAASLNLLDSTLGGPTALLARGGGSQIDDNGQELVDLIERTINPDFWDTNGGPGTIVYYQPLMCLVVTATGEMHGNLGGLLGGLRAAGGP
jgi:hypothetical protein